jgi:eukaryotic-like serine/threonine-protein kinase
MNFQVLNLRVFRSGGNGDLYVGHRSDTRDAVVVKFLREFHLPHSRKAFAREVRLLERKLHGIVPLLGSGSTADRPFYVMPYLKGGSLLQYAGRLTGVQLRAVAADLARTLANLHAANDLHGDFKPDNILLTEQGELQVADPLGNGSLVTILFSENRGGTPGYMAPEIAAGASISRPGDVYSYGTTLCHLLTGHLPQQGQRLDPKSRAFGNTPEICEIISVCCHADPNDRPSMQEVLRLLSGTAWADIQAERKQRQEFATAAGVVGVLLLLGAALSS